MEVIIDQAYRWKRAQIQCFTVDFVCSNGDSEILKVCDAIASQGPNPDPVVVDRLLRFNSEVQL